MPEGLRARDSGGTDTPANGSPTPTDPDNPGVASALLVSGMAKAGVTLTEPLRFARIRNPGLNAGFAVTDAAGTRFVLLRPPPGAPPVAVAAATARLLHTAAALRLLESTPVPAPRVYGLGRSPDTDTTAVPMLLTSHLDGTRLESIETLKGLDTTARSAIADSVAETLAALHAVDVAGKLRPQSDPADADAAPAGQPDNPAMTYAQAELTRCTALWMRLRSRANATLEDLTRRLAVARPAQTETTLIHGEFDLGKLVLSPQTGAVVGVLSWESASSGEPLVDLARMLTRWPRTAELDGLDGLATRDELAQRYLERTGRDGNALQYYYALAMWRRSIDAELQLTRLRAAANANPAVDAAVIESAEQSIETLLGETAKAVAAAEQAIGGEAPV